MSVLSLGGAACAGLCVGGGCVAQIGLIVRQLWQEHQHRHRRSPQHKRSREGRSRRTRRHVVGLDEEIDSEGGSMGSSYDGSSGEVEARVAIATSRKTAIQRQNNRRRSKQKTNEEQPSTTTNGLRQPEKQNTDKEQPFIATDGFLDAGWQGFSMEDSRNLAEAASAESMRKTPGDVLADLQRGNTRFWMGIARRPEKSAFHRRALLTKQFPTVAVLSCSDSRVPVEIVFDVGLGDMFVVRVAGNCLDTTTLASVQYAVHHLKVKVLVVMGHEGCGAVKAAGLPAADIDREPEILGRFLRTLGQGLDRERLSNIRDKRACDREAVVSNVSTQVGRITMDAGIMGKIQGKELIVVGAFYEISSGIVDFFSEVSEDLPSTGLHRGVSSSLSSDAAKKDFSGIGGFHGCGFTPTAPPAVGDPPAPIVRPIRTATKVQRLAQGQTAAPIEKPITGVKMLVDQFDMNPSTNTAMGS